MKSDIFIPSPCSKQLNELEPDSKGNYNCSTCKHKVHDFRKKGLSDVKAIIQQSKEKICGVFYTDQLDQNGSFSRIRLRKFVMASMLVFGLGLYSNAQQAISIMKRSVAAADNQIEQAPFQFSIRAFRNKTLSLDDFEIEVKTDDGISSLQVREIPDQENVFSLIVPSALYNKEIELIVESADYMTETLPFTFTTNKDEKLSINLTPKEFNRFISVGCPSF